MMYGMYTYTFMHVLLPARDPVLKDQVSSGNITHSKHGHVTGEKTVLNGECSPFKAVLFLFPSNMTMF